MQSVWKGCVELFSASEGYSGIFFEKWFWCSSDRQRIDLHLRQVASQPIERLENEILAERHTCILTQMMCSF